MFEHYWRKFVDAKVAQEYYQAYSIQSGRIEWGLNALCMLATCSGLVAIFSNAPVLGAAVAATAQCVCALQPILPFGKRKDTAGYVYKEYTDLVIHAEQTLYRGLRGEEEEYIVQELYHIGRDMEAIEDKYSTAGLFPPNMHLHKRAEKAALQYINVHFDVEG